jgi:DNA-binding transcriptional regulator YhcF (GntR family)
MNAAARHRPARRRAGPGTGQRPTSAYDVEKAILVRVASGAYAPNERLPTCEQFAAELGVNKNTVSKAYRSLAEQGYLRTVAGRGTFVAKRPAKADPGHALADVSSLLALVVQEAKLAGIDREQFRELVEETTARYYDGSSVRLGFMECNRLDATVLSRDLQLALAHPVEPLLIDEVIADPERYVGSYDILAVNLTHLAVVEERLRRVEGPGRAEILGLLVPPDPESLTQVARLRPGTRLGIVCDLPATLQALGGLVAAYNPGVRAAVALASDEQALRRLLKGADAILVTPSASEGLLAHGPNVPLISVSFKVDERSVQQLADRLAARRRRELPTAV